MARDGRRCEEKDETMTFLPLLPIYRNPMFILHALTLGQWRGERYDGTSTRTGPLQSKKLKIELKDNAKNE